MKIVPISDTHGLHRWVGERARGAYGRDVPKIPMGDVLVHAGDFSGFGERMETIDFADWVMSLPHKHKVVIAGNHDWFAFNNPLETEQHFSRRGIHYLCDSAVTIEGVKFYGTPYTPMFYDWAFMESEDELAKRYAKIHTDTDVLVTHGPPYDILDQNQQKIRTGSVALANRIAQVQPRLSIFGHIHEGRDPRWTSQGTFQGDKTTFYNVSFLNMAYKPYGIPQPVIELG